jgi:hypothetical protein
LFLADRFAFPPASISGFAFRSDEEALRYGLKYPSRPGSTTAHLAIVDATEIDGPLP